ncbi:MAG: HAD family hydrolase [Chlamydiae bacterium]|nr:HAD family hydrolase [Chlamydiota bacterium]MBI3267325.1 HAD family hydrolase [Chlamydiota bacterium]
MKAILFDLDGTLLDTLADLADSMNTVLKSFGLPLHPTESYKDFVGEGVEYLAWSALPEIHRKSDMISRTVKQMREEYHHRWAEKTHPYPGISELLDELERKKIKTAILSNKPDDFTKLIVRKFLGKWKFDVIQGAHDEMPKKPNPSSALQIASKMKVDAKNFIFLGDTKIDMETASRAGMFPVGALWGFRTAEELIASGAKKLIHKPLELLKAAEF